MGSFDSDDSTGDNEDYSTDEGSDSEPTTEHGKELGADLPGQPLAFVIMTCVISGYTLVGPLQHSLKVRLKVHDTGGVGEIFTQSVALVQWGKTYSTLGQNIFLACFSPVIRVYFSMLVMFFGVLIPPLMVFTLNSSWLGWVTVSYLCIGLALGVFECTYLSVISFLGPRTKSMAIMGFPAAFAIVNILGQSLMAIFDMPVVYIFWYIVVCMPIAFLLFRKIVPQEEGKASAGPKRQAPLMASFLTEWQAWVPNMIPFCLVNIVSHFVMESVLPAVFNTFNDKQVSLLGATDNTALFPTRWYMVILSTMMAVGDMSSRKIGYCFAFDTLRANYAGLAFALACCSLGLLLTMTGTAWIVVFAVTLAFFGAGFNYAVTSKYIDRFVPKKHNLASYSLWMFVGYCGAIAGAVLVDVVRAWICDGQVYEHQCLE